MVARHRLQTVPECRSALYFATALVVLGPGYQERGAPILFILHC